MGFEQQPNDLDFTNNNETRAEPKIEKAHLSGKSKEELEDRRAQLANIVTGKAPLPEGMPFWKAEFELQIVANELAAIRDKEIEAENAAENDKRYAEQLEKAHQQGL